MAERETVYVLADNGSVMPHDLPLPSGIADRVARGALRLVNADGTEIEPESEKPADDGALPSGSIAVVLGWVGDDHDRAMKALEAEQAADRPRKSLVAALEAMLTDPEQ